MIEMLCFLALLTGATVGAARMGGSSERAAAALFILAWGTTLMIQIVGDRLDSPRATLLVDLAVLTCLIALAWKFQRTWPAFAAAFQAIGVAAHLAYFYGAIEAVGPYLKVTGLAGFGTVGALAFSLWRRRE
ncbi:hypothetical protein [Caulobacter sp. NIBR2454]|uniref:hypothetical protein n=1 Tax=Caulobacter sp. NIBR2454 TaxID=3015996 RepID=UPI0022B5F1F4|nr:hypothetical protein [Caulobacter sp. NIBR2454]